MAFVYPVAATGRTPLGRTLTLDRIRAFAFEALPTIPDDLTAIERAIAEVGARLVILDPLVAFFSRAVHAYRDHDVRRALTPLMALAERTGAAVLAIRHLNKARTARAKYRGSGSIGILGAARSALLVARDPDDSNRRLLAPVKQNLAVAAPAVVFSLVPAGTTARDRVAWRDLPHRRDAPHASGAGGRSGGAHGCRGVPAGSARRW